MHLGDKEVSIYQPVVVTTVLVYNYPFKGYDKEITTYFETFGTVRSGLSVNRLGQVILTFTPALTLLKYCFETADHHPSECPYRQG